MTGAQRGTANLGSINGERISEEEYIKARQEVFLRTFFTTGNWPDEEARKQGGEIERDTYQWLLLIQKQNQLGIHISTDVVAQAAKAMISQFQRAGINSPEMFIKQVLKPRGFGADDLERFVRHYIGVQELIATIGLGGKLVTPQEVRDLYKREHEEVATAAVFFSASNYLAGVTAPPDAVMQFYTNRQAIYRIPDRVQVSYVKFRPDQLPGGGQAGPGPDDQSGPADRGGVSARRDQLSARSEGTVPGGGQGEGPRGQAKGI